MKQVIAFFLLVMFIASTSVCLGSNTDDLLLIRKLDIRYCLYLHNDSDSGIRTTPSPTPTKFQTGTSYIPQRPVYNEICCAVEITNNSDKNLDNIQVKCDFGNSNEAENEFSLQPKAKQRAIFHSGILLPADNSTGIQSHSRMIFLTSKEEQAFMTNSKQVPFGAYNRITAKIDSEDRTIEPKYIIRYNNKDFKYR